MNKNNKWAIGVDVGGTKIDVAAVDENGKVLIKERIPTLVEKGSQGIIRDIVTSIKTIQSQMATSPLGAGIGIPGQIDSEHGLIHFAPNLNWVEVPLKPDLMTLLDLPIAIMNDVRASTFGEWKFGAGKGSEEIVCLFIGTGIGGGLVAKGQLLTGVNNCCGEFGHLTIDFNGPSCTCGNRGCLEAFAGGWAIAKNAKSAIVANPKNNSLVVGVAEKQGKEITAEMVVNAYRQGDLLATDVIKQAFEGLIAGGITIANGINPERLIFGGGIMEGLPEIVSIVDQGIRAKALPAASQRLQVMRGQLGLDAGVIGAATYMIVSKETIGT